ncbi:cupin domain-containing protein [Chloroflexota bacterium]
MPGPAKSALYTFTGQSGYIIPGRQSKTQDLVTVRHSAMVAPWADGDIHMHTNAEEYYLLLHGELWLLVGETLINLKPYEILMVKPQTPHAILRGQGQIEHIGIRAPAISDRQSLAANPADLLPVSTEDQRQLIDWWGCRAPLSTAENQNCWLFGAGRAKFESQHLSLAFLDFPSQQAAASGIGTRHRLHLHQRAWEYYCVLQGEKTLQVEDQFIKVKTGQILEVPPGVKHTLYDRTAPYRGFTLRVPIALDDKIEFEDK